MKFVFNRKANRKRLQSVASLMGLALVAIVAGLFNARQDGALPSGEVASRRGGYALTGDVVRVADGDTFTLLVDKRQERIRLASIDAPESTQSSERPGQPFSSASRKALADMIAGKRLTLRCFEQDRYGRHICDVPLPEGGTANQRMVASGMAWANLEGKGKYLRDPSLPELERQAREQGLGLWRDGKPIAPWQWRHDCWRQGHC